MIVSATRLLTIVSIIEPATVITNKQKDTVMKGKNAAIEKWEAELRSSLASKKTSKSPVNLSKHDKELLDVQLRKEAEIRRGVNNVISYFRRGFAFIRSTVNAKSEEFALYLPSVVSYVLESSVKQAAVLIREDAYATFIVSAADLSVLSILMIVQVIGQTCSDRLGLYRAWIGMATLRCLNAEIVPDDLKVEPLHCKRLLCR